MNVIRNDILTKNCIFILLVILDIRLNPCNDCNSTHVVTYKLGYGWRGLETDLKLGLGIICTKCLPSESFTGKIAPPIS